MTVYHEISISFYTPFKLLAQILILRHFSVSLFYLLFRRSHLNVFVKKAQNWKIAAMITIIGTNLEIINCLVIAALSIVKQH